MTAREEGQAPLIPSRVGVVDERNNGNKESNEDGLSSAISPVSVAHTRRNQAPAAAHWVDAHRGEIEAFGPIPGADPVCMVVGCERTPLVHDLCKQHYRKARRLFGPIGSADG